MKRGLFLLTLAIAFFAAAPAIAQSGEEASEAKVTIVKYSDYQCPACAYFVPFEEQLKEDFGDDIEFTTKHFPLNMHQYAQLASRVAEAARQQGKYQEMHDLIFEGQDQWSRGNAESIFIGYAKDLKLDIEEFREDMNSAEMQRIIMEDKREGLNKNVNSTPTFFINGQKLERNPRTYEQFKTIVESYMKQS
ncbi:DsbA family protein [Gracilimonas mengyeensis]|uniref:Thioredoxin n=1 Tax=Gracilimonas mengyeensis TaxID=1302730 RepID=A0A521CZ24_9BACT|nr:thioredoxin domain-containing protein [Gracilimonas mengyeensis]SMO63930.1 Thioredoxin [Gracilimonas mengyeensis]